MCIIKFHISARLLKTLSLVFLIQFFCGQLCWSNIDNTTSRSLHSWTVGVSGGYGSTTWQGLVPTAANQSEALSLLTPIKATEGGAVWGAFIDYECSTYFGLEANYMQYPTATIHFDKNSLFTFEHDEQESFQSNTRTAFAVAKIMMPFPKTQLRLFSGAGIAGVYRNDIINTQTIASPVFTVGFRNLFSERILIELAGHYIAGQGEAELEPSQDYMPFLYAIYLKIGYRFG